MSEQQGGQAAEQKQSQQQSEQKSAQSEQKSEQTTTTDEKKTSGGNKNTQDTMEEDDTLDVPPDLVATLKEQSKEELLELLHLRLKEEAILSRKINDYEKKEEDRFKDDVAECLRMAKECDMDADYINDIQNATSVTLPILKKSVLRLSGKLSMKRKSEAQDSDTTTQSTDTTKQSTNQGDKQSTNKQKKSHLNDLVNQKMKFSLAVNKGSEYEKRDFEGNGTKQSNTDKTSEQKVFSATDKINSYLQNASGVEMLARGRKGFQEELGNMREEVEKQVEFAKYSKTKK